MIICSLDPSTNAIGYAFKYLNGDWFSVGLITPHSASDSWMQKCMDMEPMLRRKIDLHKPDQYIIEEPDPARAFKRKGKVISPRGAATYGCAVGWVTHLCAMYARKAGHAPADVIDLAMPKVWKTKLKMNKRNKSDAALFGNTHDKKAKVKFRARAVCPIYQERFDLVDGDRADAVCLLDWFEAKKRIEGLK